MILIIKPYFTQLIKITIISDGTKGNQVVTSSILTSEYSVE